LPACCPVRQPVVTGPQTLCRLTRKDGTLDFRRFCLGGPALDLNEPICNGAEWYLDRFVVSDKALAEVAALEGLAVQNPEAK